MDTTRDLFLQRQRDLIDASDLKKPKAVPITANMLTFPIAYAKQKTADLITDPVNFAEKWTNIYKDVYYDASFANGMSCPLEAVRILGSSSFFISSDEVTVQHTENCAMKSDEYDSLAAAPEEFIINTLAPRKFKNLNGSSDEIYETLKKAAAAYRRFAAANKEVLRISEEKYGIVPITGSKAYAPLDVVFDRLRGFAGTLTDLRRFPKKVTEAAEALYPVYSPLTRGNGEFPFAASTLHSVPYLGIKGYSEAFWPTYKKMLLDVFSRGSKTVMVMEGNWSRYYDYLKELPEKSIVMNLEDDDPFAVKRELGKQGAVAAAVPVNMLRHSSERECIDYAKKLVDECACDGGLIFMTDRSLISEKDVKIENVIAVNKFVHEYRI